MYRLYKIFHPDIFQGKNQKKHYFEGWYYKIIDSNKQHALAIIPGISIEAEETHAFIQVLDHSNNSYYFRYHISEFYYNDKRFEIMIGNNYFSDNRIRLRMKGNTLEIQGELYFHNIIKFPQTILRPGIMGPYSYVPNMECYHGIVNIHQDISGQLNVKGKSINFQNGYGYIEKDWGRSFPEAWIWIQSNHFGSQDVTLMFSMAKIPWFHKSFPGFLTFLRYQELVYIFATYTGAKIRRLTYHKDHIRVIVQDLRFRLDIKVNQALGGTLMAPKNGCMNRALLESINAELKVRFSDRRGNIIYQGTGTNTGLEISGNLFDSKAGW